MKSKIQKFVIGVVVMALTIFAGFNISEGALTAICAQVGLCSVDTPKP